MASGQKRLVSKYIKKTNHYAIAGFLLPFAAAGVSGALILTGGYEFKSSGILIGYLTLVPLILLLGLVSSLKAIPLIPERGDKDYAYCGLALNIFFLLLYIVSIIVLAATLTK